MTRWEEYQETKAAEARAKQDAKPLVRARGEDENSALESHESRRQCTEAPHPVLLGPISSCSSSSQDRGAHHPVLLPLEEEEGVVLQDSLRDDAMDDGWRPTIVPDWRSQER